MNFVRSDTLGKPGSPGTQRGRECKIRQPECLVQSCIVCVIRKQVPDEKCKFLSNVIGTLSRVSWILSKPPYRANEPHSERIGKLHKIIMNYAVGSKEAAIWCGKQCRPSTKKGYLRHLQDNAYRITRVACHYWRSDQRCEFQAFVRFSPIALDDHSSDLVNNRVQRLLYLLLIVALVQSNHSFGQPTEWSNIHFWRISKQTTLRST